MARESEREGGRGREGREREREKGREREGEGGQPYFDHGGDRVDSAHVLDDALGEVGHT